MDYSSNTIIMQGVSHYNGHRTELAAFQLFSRKRPRMCWNNLACSYFLAITTDLEAESTEMKM